jgi:hypothetical protein
VYCFSNPTPPSMAHSEWNIPIEEPEYQELVGKRGYAEVFKGVWHERWWRNGCNQEGTVDWCQ